MLTLIGSVIAALLAFGLGIGAIMMALTPFFLLILVPLVPVLLVVVILRRLGVIRGTFMSLVAVVIGLFLVGGGLRLGWSHGQHWLAQQRKTLDSCIAQGGGQVIVEHDESGFHLICRPAKAPPKQGEPPQDAHI